MPGWYIHMDVPRKAMPNLATNPGATNLFNTNSPSIVNITRITERNPANVALGAIGPDIFFLLPDFKPPVGKMLYGAAKDMPIDRLIILGDIFDFWTYPPELGHVHSMWTVSLENPYDEEFYPWQLLTL